MGSRIKSQGAKLAKTKNLVVIAIVLVVLWLVGYLLYRYFFYTCCALPPKRVSVSSQSADLVLVDPNLLFSKRALIGFCRTKSGDGGSCHFNTYLYLSGKLVVESGELTMGSDGEIATAYPTVQKQLDKKSMTQITEQIRNTIIKNELCKTDVTKMINDVYITYYVNLEGIKKEVEFPACETEFGKVDELINTAK